MEKIPKYCPYCGSKLEGNPKFCFYCGNKLLIDNISTINREDSRVSVEKSMKETDMHDQQVNAAKIDFGNELGEPKEKFYESSRKKGFSKKLAVVTIILIVLFSFISISILAYEENRLSLKQNEYNMLQNNFNSLQSEHNKLTSDYSRLNSNYNSLQNNYNSLQSQYNNLQFQYEQLETGFSILDDEYKFYKNQIEFRYGDGGDCQQFVTPDDPDVIAKTRSVLGHYSDGDLSWDDKIKINDWVYNNIEYNYDTFIGTRRNCFFYPRETLEQGYGDCEDQAVLMASMCKAEEDVSWVYCASVSYIKDGERVGHVFVINNIENDQMYIFDQTHSRVWGGGWHSSTSMSEPEAISEYESAFGYSSLEIEKIFNDNMYRYFSSNQEFYDYF